MKKVFLLAALLLFSQRYGQSQTDYSKIYLDELFNQSSQINSFKPDDVQFDDLEPIGKSIGDASVVMLGEPSHGDGGAISLKTRLVKYLHEKKGFDVVLFEADYYSILFGLSLIKDTSKISQAAKDNIYTCWSESKVSQEFWNYYKKQMSQQNPLIIGGVDCRHSGMYAKNNLLKNLKEILLKTGYPVHEGLYLKFEKDIQYLLSNEFSSKKDSVDSDNLFIQLTEIEENMQFSQLETIQRNLWMIELNNLKNCINLLLENQNRDIAMGQNFFAFLKHIFPDKKIIIWSHNNHNLLDVNAYASMNPEFSAWWHENNTYKGFTYMGSDLFRKLGRKVYSLGITSNQGNFSPSFFGKDYFHADFTKTAKVPASSNNSLEKYLENKKSEIRFIPFPDAQGMPSEYPWFSARLMDLQYEAKIDYTSCFDGILFINHTVDLNGK